MFGWNTVVGEDMHEIFVGKYGSDKIKIGSKVIRYKI